MTNRAIDFNGVLAALNLVVTGLLVYALCRAQDNVYVDQETISLGIVLCIQTHAALRIERRQRDPFVILLAFTTILYYSLRIFTLTLYEHSDVFYRFPYDAGDSNYALIFILIANLCLYFGLYLVKSKGEQAVNTSGWEATSSARVVLLMVAAIFFAYFSGSAGSDAEAGGTRLLSILSIFLAPNVIVLMVLSYFVLFRKSLSPAFSFALAALIAVEMIVHTLIGSRSAIVVFVQNCIFVGLALNGFIKIKRKYVLLGVAMLPVLAVMLVAAFGISTYNRAARVAGSPLDLNKAFESAMEFNSTLSPGSTLDLVLPPVFSRAGFFDYSAEIIAHRQQYKWVINLAAYGKSIVDNILTPGFDVYDQPKIGNALQFAYQDIGDPSKELLSISDTYQSDQLGIYGEFYALFAYGALPVLFAGAYLLKRVYVGLRSANPFNLLMRRVVVLLIFERTVDSYGIDWTIEEAIPLVVAILIYAVIFSIRRTKPPRAAQVVPARSLEA
jgi:hypothetical protein